MGKITNFFCVVGITAACVFVDGGPIVERNSTGVLAGEGYSCEECGAGWQ
ncbi:hypothetical protein [Nocardiopsis alba]